MYQYSLEERVFIVKTYWITGSIKNCQRRFVEQFGGKQAPRISPHDWLTARAASSWLSLSYLIFSCCQLPFCEFPKHRTALHYRYDMHMYCTFVLFVNQHFPGLPGSWTHCIMLFWTIHPTMSIFWRRNTPLITGCGHASDKVDSGLLQWRSRLVPCGALGGHWFSHAVIMLLIWCTVLRILF
jgi:hypothetical protein